MAQTKDLRVRYKYVGENGGVQTSECFLSLIPKSHIATISDITIFNSADIMPDRVGAYITSQIHDFPALLKLAIPQAYTMYVSHSSFKNCPNLKKILTFGEKTLSQSSKVSRISGVRDMNFSTVDATDDNLASINANADMIGKDETYTYIISRDNVATATSKKVRKYTPSLKTQVKALQDKVDEINSRITDPANKITDINIDVLTQIFNIVESRGIDSEVFDREYSKIYDDLSRINVSSIDQSTLNETVQDILVGGINTILVADFENTAKELIEKTFVNFNGESVYYDLISQNIILQLVKSNANLEGLEGVELFNSTMVNVQEIIERANISSEAKVYLQQKIESLGTYPDLEQMIGNKISESIENSEVLNAVKEGLEAANLTPQKIQLIATEITDQILTNESIKNLSKEDLKTIKGFVSGVVKVKDLNKAKEEVIKEIGERFESVPTQQFIIDNVCSKLQEVASKEQVEKLYETLTEIAVKENLSKDDVESILTTYTQTINNNVSTEAEEIKELIMQIHNDKLRRDAELTKEIREVKGEIKTNETRFEDLKQGILNLKNGVETKNDEILAAVKDTNSAIFNLVQIMTRAFAAPQNPVAYGVAGATPSVVNVYGGTVNFVQGQPVAQQQAVAGINPGQIPAQNGVQPQNPNPTGVNPVGAAGATPANTGTTPTGTPNPANTGNATGAPANTGNTTGTPANIGTTPTGTPKQNPAPTKAPVKPATVKVLKHRPIKDTVKVQALEQMNMLKEPKLPWFKRVGKFIARHPFRSTLIGLGVGAAIASGVGAAALGGWIHVLHMANYFSGYLMAGAVSGAGLGFAGSVISRFSKKGRKERLYAKFLKIYKKCNKYKTRGNLKSRRVFKIARSLDLIKNRFYSARRRANKRKYAKAIEKAYEYKTKLNDLESRDKKGKDMALGNYMNKRRKAESKHKSGEYDDEDFDERMEDLEDSFADKLNVDKEEQSGLKDVSEDYRTFDSEMESLIEGMKSKKSTHLVNALAEIKARNSHMVTKDEEIDLVETYVAEEQDLTQIDQQKIDDLKKNNIEGYKQFVKARQRQIDEKDKFEQLKKIDPKMAQELEAGKTIKNKVPPQSTGPTP